MNYLSIDPGLRMCGVAAWRTGGATTEMLSARLVRGQARGMEHECWKAMADAVWQFGWEVWPDGGTDGIISEFMRTYGGKASKGDTNDLFQVNAVVATIVSGCNNVVLYRPQEWKGSQPKAVTKARVDLKLSRVEKSGILWPAPSLCHNVVDAIGIGLKHFGR